MLFSPGYALQVRYRHLRWFPEVPLIHHQGYIALFLILVIIIIVANRDECVKSPHKETLGMSDDDVDGVDDGDDDDDDDDTYVNCE